MGNTLRWRVTAPVMPSTECTGTPRSRLTNAVVIVAPTEGPSRGVAPEGTWRSNRFPVMAAGSMSFVAHDHLHLRATALKVSFQVSRPD